MGSESVRTLSGNGSSPEKDRSAATDTKSNNNNNNPWALTQNLVESDQCERDAGIPRRELGITWKDLSVRVQSSEAAIHENIVSQLNIPKLILESRRKPPLRTILDNSYGCVKPGEMLLVLGRPGSGCTTLLNMLANKRRGYREVSGDVFYGSLSASEAGRYRDQIVMNTEEEIHFPALTVQQTMDFATRLKIPARLPNGITSEEDWRVRTRDFLMESMGITHTHSTKVGDAFTRGVSGGERKRVSLIECLASRGSIFCWDNPTRGLDASTALEYTKAIRAMSDVLGLTSIVTVYQAGNGIYDLFDKVLVLDEGKQIFYGPVKEARPFMEDLGFVCAEGANVADFLTGVTVPSERKVREDAQTTFPRNATQLLAQYEKSSIRQAMQAEAGYHETAEAKKKTEDFCESVRVQKHDGVSQKSPMTVGFAAQVRACVIRQYEIIWGDKATFAIKQFGSLVMAVIAGSLFYDAPEDTSGIFIKAGACFFALLFNTLMAMSEVTDSFTGRPVLLKHKSFAFYHPSAFCIAQIAADIPLLLLQVSIFTVVTYFMAQLQNEVAHFFIFWFIVFSATMCMTALFRATGAAFSTFDAASKVSGLAISLGAVYAGYMITEPDMHPWFVWIYWINPLSYGFNALLSNEFHDMIIPCAGPNLIPSGPMYTDSRFQSCSGVPGVVPNQPYVTGDDYLDSLSYSYDALWRNIGILWAWWALFVFITVVSTSNWKTASETGPSLVIPRELARLQKPAHQADEEGQATEKTGQTNTEDSNSLTETANGDAGLVRNTSVFTWKDLSYTVKTPDGDRTLLNNVQGWVKPGTLGALMGASGAGKTTLLDVLAQRKTEGTVRGSIMVDGRPLPVSFQRSAGYCEQLDVHEPYATVREALEFSALLRQSRDTPREEKLKYVDTIIDLLELHDIADTLIGQVGAGLSIEQRKRVTIGVELVSKPSILIFLDEPTSGLDGQSAYNTVRFLRKLASVGQAVLVTIHQPSAQLFAQFDTLLLLAKGGRTVYFGDIGEQAQTIKDYFGHHGAPCPDNTNPAEHMIDVVSGVLSQGRDWAEVWESSPEHKAISQELDRIIDDAAAKPPATQDDGHEFATSMMEQIKLVTHRMNVSLYRNTDYINNKLILHIVSALFIGFTFWDIGNSVADLQLRLFAIFNFIFVAPGVIAQLQPLFIQRRDIFETREKKSKMYSWVAFVTALIVSEVPYLCVCAVLYFVCWYYTINSPTATERAGGTFLVMLLYEFLYTGIGQFIAAYAPNEVFASLVNPIILGILICFCGVLVPYAQIQAFWRHWIYWLNPFNYLMGSMLVFNISGQDVNCSDEEFAVFNPPANTTCGDYLRAYLDPRLHNPANLVNPEATSECRVCAFSVGDNYLRTVNLDSYSVAWRDVGIVAGFVASSYALVYVLMKLRTKTSKKAQ
ncbi:ABC-2 type transporter-domain-containing protein [Stachybotrys elegans]|uniref:ABC-2 type transporter-domain-containing protein n=1 Tax=Stachybotrys elegans TaxID=80388 RepID=A0A8K0WLA9_9HYPO|nr:ABC-2 type transporter-domain-containing protein [Stachybotrys elegans]